jgi:hypothetical protein
MNNQTGELELHDVVSCAFIENYVLNVRFDDGSERIIDFAPILIGPLFGPLLDPKLFRQVRVDADLGTLVWPTGADIDPSVCTTGPGMSMPSFSGAGSAGRWTMACRAAASSPTACCTRSPKRTRSLTKLTGCRRMPGRKPSERTGPSRSDLSLRHSQVASLSAVVSRGMPCS